MSKEKKLDILKGAILLEHRGKALYQSVAQSSASQAVKELFLFLAAEEDKHIEVLNSQFVQVKKGEPVNLSEVDLTGPPSHEHILTDDIITQVSGAGYEAAAISAALEFEKNAVAFYSQQESSAATPEEKKLFGWLTEWEKGHMEMLADIDNRLREQVWYDNQFWPIG
jgi:rubrerythrin